MKRTRKCKIKTRILSLVLAVVLVFTTGLTTLASDDPATEAPAAGSPTTLGTSTPDDPQSTTLGASAPAITPFAVGNDFTVTNSEGKDITYHVLTEAGATGTVEVIANTAGKYTGDIVIPATVENSGITYTVTAIGSDAFRGCSGLTNVTIPDSVTTIGSDAFSGCTSLTMVTIPNSVTTIGSNAFYGCSGLTEVTIPNSVTAIEEYVFYGCTSLTAVTIPDSVTAIGKGTFYGCTSLTAVTIPDSVTAIGDSAFYGCTSLTAVTIPDSVVSIGGGAFSACDRLSIISVEGGNQHYSGADGVLFNKEKSLLHTHPTGKPDTAYTIPPTVTKIEPYAFAGNTALTTLQIPDIVDTIGWDAFQGCTSLETVTLPQSLTFLSSNLFENCTSLTEITIPQGVIYIDSFAFSNCTALTTVKIPDTVSFIGRSAFRGCSSLTEITIPQGVTRIGDIAFSNCTALTKVTFLRNTPPTVGSLNPFLGINITLVVVPQGREAAYAGFIPRSPSIVPFYTISISSAENGSAAVTQPANKAPIRGETVTLSTTPDVGYQFKEWQVVSGGVNIVNNSFTMPDSSVEVQGIFELIPPNTYTVTFDPGGGTLVSGSIHQTVTHGSGAVAPTFARDGYTFDAWDKDFSSITENLTVTAKWTQNPPNTYTVTFDPGGGTLVTGSIHQTVTHGSGAVAPAFARDGYTFDGWDKDFSSVTGNLTVTAKWTQNPPNTYTVTFDPGGGTLVSGTLSQTVTHGSGAVAPTFAKDGYTFDGWDKDFSSITGNLTVTAKWTQNPPNTYTVTFDPAGGTLVTGSMHQTVTHGSSAVAPTFARDGYTFAGWDTDFSSITGNLTVTAKWTLIPANTYTVTFDPDGGTLVSGTLSQAVTHGSGAVAPAFARDGYTFAGWDKDFSSITGNLTVTAKWTLIPPPPPVSNYTGGSSGSSGGTNKADTSPVAGRAFTKPEAIKLFNTALAAKPAGQTTLSFRAANYTRADKSALTELAALAQKNGVTLTVHFDKVVGKAVVYRLSINPASITTNLDLTAKLANGKITLPKFAVPAEIAVKMPTGVTMENLKITQNGKDITASAKPWLDKVGYLHFTTTGGEILLGK